ncbi:hypothetical protein SRABI27_05043 [Pedobacter sp. Bi27]|nr:hypothetical protein SRABI27_05043 [Pedobacter sp. Bi27]
MTGEFKKLNLLRYRHCEKAFSADEAILQLSLVASALRLLRASQ